MRWCCSTSALGRWFFLTVIMLTITMPYNLEASSLPAGLKGRLFVGYQGWFGCPGDFEGNTEWYHWFTSNTPDAAHLRVDLLPSVGRFESADLCSTDLRGSDGSTVSLFSSQNTRVVAAHFEWMSQNGIDGAAVQRFVGVLSDTKQMRRSDNVMLNVKAGAEGAGRIFYITYDVSGASSQSVISDIRKDWKHLVNDLKLTSSSSYLKANGKPVLQLWGFGFTDRPGSPAEVLSLIDDLKAGNDGLEAVTLIGGVPTHWRTLTEDSKTDVGWAWVYRSYDVISPWSVGRFGDEDGADSFIRSNVVPDLEETGRLQIGYMPVIFPGFSWYNLMTGMGLPQKAILNQIPRQCGDFLWRQVYNLLGTGIETMYAAMFDEADEGTALFPIAARSEGLSQGGKIVYPDQDGCSLPADWYLQVTGQAAKFLRGGQLPPKILKSAMGATSLAADFGSKGLWVLQDMVWKTVAESPPEKLTSYSRKLVADFPGYGIYEYDGATLTAISSHGSFRETPGSDSVYIDASGLWRWNGEWTQLSANAPGNMVSSGSYVYADFPSWGLYEWNGSSWSRINANAPVSMVAWGNNLYANYGEWGLWSWNGSAWTQISATYAKSMCIAGSILYVDFSPYGLWQWDGSSWTQIDANSPEGMVPSGANLYANYGAWGLWQWNGSGWSQLTPNAPGDMAVGGASLFASFGSWGVWQWDGSSWTMLSPMEARQIVVVGNN